MSYTDQIKSIGGVTVGDVRYNIQTKGYTYGEVAVVQHIELYRDGEVLMSVLNTDRGRRELMLNIRAAANADEISWHTAKWLGQLVKEVR